MNVTSAGNGASSMLSRPAPDHDLRRVTVTGMAESMAEGPTVVHDAMQGVPRRGSQIDVRA